MARTKDVVLTPGQKELMEKEYLDFVKPSMYGNKANPSSCNSLYDDVENPELRTIVENVAATIPYREETSTNEAQSPPNPQKRISGKQRKATLEEYQQTFLQVPRIDDRKPVFVSSDVRDRLDRVVRILGGRRMSVSGIIENIVRHQQFCIHLLPYAVSIKALGIETVFATKRTTVECHKRGDALAVYREAVAVDTDKWSCIHLIQV